MFDLYFERRWNPPLRELVVRQRLQFIWVWSRYLAYCWRCWYASRGENDCRLDSILHPSPIPVCLFISVSFWLFFSFFHCLFVPVVLCSSSSLQLYADIFSMHWNWKRIYRSHQTIILGVYIVKEFSWFNSHNSEHSPSSWLSFKIRLFGDFILSQSSGETYSIGFNK